MNNGYIKSQQSYTLYSFYLHKKAFGLNTNIYIVSRTSSQPIDVMRIPIKTSNPITIHGENVTPSTLQVLWYFGAYNFHKPNIFMI